jgi:hypothetical protein
MGSPWKDSDWPSVGHVTASEASDGWLTRHLHDWIGDEGAGRQTVPKDVPIPIPMLVTKLSLQM